MAQMASSLFDDVATGTPADDPAAQERSGASLWAVPCPALHPETDACELYGGRPMACRTYGPPITTGAEHRHPCRLWFDGARPEDVESCRVRFGGEEVESEGVDRAEGSGQRRGPTIIAAVLAEE
jgi:Fe-S-cluster containining protein